MPIDRTVSPRWLFTGGADMSNVPQLKKKSEKNVPSIESNVIHSYQMCAHNLINSCVVSIEIHIQLIECAHFQNDFSFREEKINKFA